MFGIGVSASTSIALTDARCEKLTSVSCEDQYAITCWPSGAFVCSVRPLQDSYRVTVQKASRTQLKGRVRVATLAMTTSEAAAYVAVACGLYALQVSGGEVAVDQDAFAVRGRTSWTPGAWTRRPRGPRARRARDFVRHLRGFIWPGPRGQRRQRGHQRQVLSDRAEEGDWSHPLRRRLPASARRQCRSRRWASPRTTA